MLFYVLLLLCTALILYYAIRNKNAGYWKKRNVIQVESILWKFVTGDRSVPEYVKQIYDASDTHVGTFHGSQPALVLKDLEDIQTVLAGEFQNFHKRGVDINPNDVLANNVIFIDDLKKWKLIRQNLTPVFTIAKLKNMFYIMDKCAKDFIDRINEDEKLRKDPFNALYIYNTASIGASVFGIDTTSNKSTMDSPFIEMSWKALAPSFLTDIKVVLLTWFPKVFMLLDMKLFGNHEKFFIGAVRNVMESRRNSTEKKHDFIDICLELQKEGIMRDTQTGYELEPTIEVLAAQAFFFFLAGSDTTANSMHFVLLDLAGEPKILSKVHEEIDSIFQNTTKLTYDDVEKMYYLDMVINESMRMHPHIGFIERKCTKDTVLPASKVLMEKDSIAIIPIFGLHKDEKHFPNPDVFDPERFSPENLSKIKKYSYLPFGGGNRTCIGYRFARLQLKAGLAWLLRSYTLKEGPKYAPDHYERSNISLRDTKARYDLIKRNI